MRSLGREAEADRQWNGNKAKKKGGKRNSDKETIFQRESRRSNRKQTARNRKRQKVSAEGVAVLLQLESGRRIPQLGLNRAE